MIRLIALAIKALFRFKVYTVFNVMGLAVSLACVLTIARYIHQENTVDHCFTDFDRICLVKAIVSNGETFLGGYQSGLEKDPAVESYTAYTVISNMPLVFGKQQVTAHAFSVDSTFFRMFPYKVVMGTNRIRRPKDVVITRSFWERVLQGKPVIGGSFTSGKGRKFTIIGIVDDPPTKTTWMPDLFMSEDVSEFLLYQPVYAMKMTPGYDLNQLNAKHRKEVPRSKWDVYQTMHYEYLPLSDLYYTNDLQQKDSAYRFGNAAYLRVLMAVAFLVGIVGLLNFINIYTIIMSRRSREFGIKKTFGAGRVAIFAQIYIENMVLVGLALLVCWTLIELTSHFFFNELYIPIASDGRFDREVSLLSLFGLPLLTTVYPYAKYTVRNPLASMREVASSRFSVRSRMAFLCFQYVLTIFMTTVALFFVRQLHYMMDADLGFRTHDIITCRMYHFPFSGNFKESKENLQDEGKRQRANKALVNKRMAESPLLEQWCRMPSIVENYEVKDYALDRAENGFHHALCFMMSRREMEMYGLQLVEGRLWNDSVDESFTKNSFKAIINESAKKQFGITDITRQKLQATEPHFASSSLPDFYNPPYEIVGVIKDFNVCHLAKSAMPVVIHFIDEQEHGLEYVTVSYRHKDRAQVTDYLRQVYEEATGRTDFEYMLIEDQLAQMYEEDRRVVNIYSLFAMVAILVSSLGLFALSLFDLRQRYREIGLRKVNGAQSRDIYPLLLRKYLWILCLAALISVPLSWWTITLYLQDFAHKAPITPDLYLVAIAITVFISLATIVWQVRKAARVNPAEVVKSE